MVLAKIRGGLIVSCQPVINGPMDRCDIVAAFGLAALAGGAVALRIEGVENVKSVRMVTDAPIIGIVKRDLKDSAVRITPFIQDVEDLVAAGANIIAFDATDRVRPVPVSDLVTSVHDAGALAMADCADFDDGVCASKLGADLLGTTLSGYLGDVEPEKPNLDLVASLSANFRYVIAEGCYRTPEQTALAVARGAYAVVVGSAITRTEHVTGWFADAMSCAVATEADA